MTLAISTIPALGRYFVFVSEKTFDPAYAEDFFCFEPMSHTANGHHLAALSGLTTLAPGESLSSSMRLALSKVTGAPQP
jgi:aldose 1-epimerase